MDFRQPSPSRYCDRPGCMNRAEASLSYEYASRRVWVGDLAERTPGAHDLCRFHADRLRPPVGWAKEDVRSPAAVDGPGPRPDDGAMPLAG